MLKGTRLVDLNGPITESDECHAIDEESREKERNDRSAHVRYDKLTRRGLVVKFPIRVGLELMTKEPWSFIVHMHSIHHPSGAHTREKGRVEWIVPNPKQEKYKL
jgi:hypothetical protein